MRWRALLLLIGLGPPLAGAAARAQGPPPVAANPGARFDQEAPAPPETPPPLPRLFTDETDARAGRSLLGNAFGLRPALAERGVSVYAAFTQFGQGVASGGVRSGAAWGGKFDLLGHLDSDGLGLWPGATLDVFAEARLGDGVDGDAGVYSPTNLAMSFPVTDQNLLAITGFTFTQAITDHAGVFVGKLNALNGDLARFVSYPLTSRFWNAAFNFNLALDRYPYSAPGAGVYLYPERGPEISFLVLDGLDSPRTSGLQRLGENGVFLYAEAKQPTEFFGLPGKQVLGGLWGGGRFDDLDPSAFVGLPDGPGIRPPKQTGTWTLLWHVEQRLWTAPDDADRGLGLYVQNGLGDGNPNPARWFFAAQVGGNSPIPGRQDDTFGVGYYHLGLGGAVKGLLPGLRDEDGVELFYNLRIAPACHLTPDVQVVRPGLGDYAPALVLGLRLKLDF
jgi:porin